jgi:hypothetical protein
MNWQFSVCIISCFIASIICQEVETGLRSNLPIIVIETQNEIIDEPKVEAFLKIFDKSNESSAMNSLTDTPLFQHKIGIEKRGESSLLHPKNSYGFELWNESNTESVEDSLFGLPEESDWILYGPYTDRSYLRNYLAYALTRQMGRWTTHTVFVELIILNSSTPLQSLSNASQEYRG